MFLLKAKVSKFNLDVHGEINHSEHLIFNLENFI